MYGSIMENIQSNKDADIFEKAVNALEWKPKRWSEAGEVCFEWIANGKHAIASFEGDGSYGYATLIGGRFVPGSVNNPKLNKVPDDLLEYLCG